MTSEATDAPPFDVESHCFVRDGVRVARLSLTEWHLFKYLWEHRTNPVPVTRLYNLIWANSPQSPDHRILSAYIYLIRKKLRGTGWRIASNMGRPKDDSFYCLQPESTPDDAWLRGFYGKGQTT